MTRKRKSPMKRARERAGQREAVAGIMREIDRDRDGVSAVPDEPGQLALACANPDEPGTVPVSFGPPGTAVGIRGVRKALALKQTQLAALLNVDPETVSRWERGELSPSPWAAAMIGQLARVAGRGNYWPGNYERIHGRKVPWAPRTPGQSTDVHDLLGPRELLADDALFEIAAIPRRWCEALIVSHGAAPYRGELRGPMGETHTPKGAGA